MTDMLSASVNRYVENGVIYIHLARKSKSVSMPFDEFMELVGLIPAIQEKTPVPRKGVLRTYSTPTSPRGVFVARTV